MRHLITAVVALSCLILGAWFTDRWVGRQPVKGGIWIVTRGPAAFALFSGLEAPGVRLVNLWWDGLVLQLHADEVNRVNVPAQHAWLVLRLPATSIRWPGCS